MDSGWTVLTEGGVQVTVLFVIAVGLIFTFIPILPGTVIIWLAVLGYGLALGWAKLGWLTFSLITLLMFLGLIADAAAGHFGAKRGGASWTSVLLGAILGFILGMVISLIASPIGGCVAGIFGAAFGVLWGELRRHQGDWNRAGRATKGYVVGAALGIIAKVISGVLMAAIFAARIFL